MDEQKNVVIVGAPRSGTSAVTAMIKDAGWDIGARARDAGTVDEEKRWEDPYWLQVCLRTFRATGSDALCPSAHHWVDLPDDVVLPMFRDKKSPWVLKEPGLALLYPMFQQFFGNHILIGVYRHPAQVAPSIMQAFGVPLARAFEMWIRYNQAMVCHAVTYGGLLVEFPSMKGLAGVSRALGKRIEPGIDTGRIRNTSTELPAGYQYLEEFYKAMGEKEALWQT